MTRTILIYLASATAALAHPGHVPGEFGSHEHILNFELIAVLGLFAYAVALGLPGLWARITRKSE
jgi:hypothetical protein